MFSELRTGSNIDVYRRNLQRAYLEQIGDLIGSQATISFGRNGISVSSTANTDIPAYGRAQLKKIRSAASRRSSSVSLDNATRIHLEDLIARIDEILDND